MSGRDVSRDGWKNRVETYLLTHFRWLWRTIQRIPFAERLINKILINRAVKKTKPRPHQFSAQLDYTCWSSLIDRTFSGRHLCAAKQSYLDSLPPVDDVVEAFRRPAGGERPSTKSTLLFSHFAQWFTDGFLRTDRSDIRKNTSNHEIDLSTLYGINSTHTKCVREPYGGYLRSQIINNEEYPPYYYDGNGAVRPEFADLKMFVPADVPADRRLKIFAMGVERANNQIGYVMLNTLFLREHNRICSILRNGYPTWDGDRLFETTRNILIAMLIKIVVEDYINHITPYYFQFRAQPASFWHEPWYRTNWMTTEFNLLYRWHSLVTDKVNCDGGELPVSETLFNNELLASRGLAAWFHDASCQRAGEIGLFNTPDFLLETERASVRHGRALRLCSYNEYRKAFNYPPATDFNQISGRREVQDKLRELYGTVDRVEFYVGLFAEDVRLHSALSPLIGRMVGVDAFSQAMTNPLLSIHVYNTQTFSPTGLEILEQTKTLGDIVRRNVRAEEGPIKVSFTLDGASRA